MFERVLNAPMSHVRLVIWPYFKGFYNKVQTSGIKFEPFIIAFVNLITPGIYKMVKHMLRPENLLKRDSNTGFFL